VAKQRRETLVMGRWRYKKNAKGHTASFHLAFSQENITRTQKKHIGNEQTLTRRHRLTRGWQREMHYKIQNIEPKMACVKANLGFMSSVLLIHYC
jgi:hypothetical protein